MAGHITSRLRHWLQHRHLPWLLAGLAVVLSLPSLWLGQLLDDDLHRAALMRPELAFLSRSPTELFVFIEGDEAVNRRSMIMGMLPWWSDEALRLAFFRPLTGLTHWLDYKIWADFPSLMHLHSLVWFGAAVAAAAFLYRRMLAPAWVAGLAALLFAVDDSHGVPAVWLANRNALIGVTFGLLTLIAHDRWRRDGRWMGAVIAPVMFLLGLLSKESTLAIGAYLAAYAIFLDRGTRVGRLVSLIPCALTGLIWWVTYKQLGYGAVGSGWYVDPSADPLHFVRMVAVRGPNLLAWQWLIPSDLEWNLSAPTAHALWLAAMGILLIVAIALLPLLKRDAVARFWAVGMVLSVLPACTAFPADRLLFFVGIGAMGLLAQFIASVFERSDAMPRHMYRRLPARALCAVLIFIHLGVAPVTLARTASSFKRYGGSVDRAAASLPSDPAAHFQTVLIVSTPSYSSFAYSALTCLLEGKPYFSRTLVLGSGSQPIEVHRPDRDTLLLRPEGGFLAPPGNPRSDREMEQLLFNQTNALFSLDRIFRDHRPMAIGRQIELGLVTVEITAITEDARPAEAAFHFAMDLQSPHFRWLQWHDRGYVPFAPPAVGETVTLPAPTIAF